MFRTRLISGAALLIFTAACSQGSSTSTAGSASSSAAVKPTEIVLPLNFSTHMNGHEVEVTPRETNAQGQLIMKVSSDRTSIDYKLTASNIENVVVSHIHQGVPNVAGPAVVFLFGPVAAGGGRHDGVLASGTFTKANLVGALAGKELSDLLNLIESGNAYVNVHTNDGIDPINTGPGDFPGGEIRGQVVK